MGTLPFEEMSERHCLPRFGDVLLDSGISWEKSGPLPIGSIAIDDVTGGLWTQLLMWAEAQGFGSSQALLSRRADPSMTFLQLEASTRTRRSRCSKGGQPLT
jgi:hypothetical protein